MKTPLQCALEIASHEVWTVNDSGDERATLHSASTPGRLGIEKLEQVLSRRCPSLTLIADGASTLHLTRGETIELADGVNVAMGPGPDGPVLSYTPSYSTSASSHVPLTVVPLDESICWEPLTLAERHRQMDRKGCVSGIVPFHIGELISLDLESVLDSLSELLVGHECLSNITYYLVGFLADGTLLLRVEGEEMDLEDDEDDEVLPCFVLVACAKQKQEQPALAADLYSSSWFKKARRFATQHGDAWAILSAKHGLVLPDTLLEPYNETLVGQGQHAREAWAVRVQEQVRAQFSAPARLILLAGRDYRDPLVRLLVADGYEVEIPMEGLGIGKQLSWLTNALT